MSNSKNDAETLFKRLDVQLYEAVEEQYFLPPRWYDCRSISQLLVDILVVKLAPILWLLSHVLLMLLFCREFKSLIEVLAVVGEKIDQGNFNSKGDDLSTALKVIDHL